MEFRVSPDKGLSFLVSEEETAHLDKHKGNMQFMTHALTFVDDKGEKDAMSGAVLGCSQSEMFKKVPWYNGFQVVLPEINDNIYLVNINTAVLNNVAALGAYKAAYSPQSEATLEIKRK